MAIAVSADEALLLAVAVRNEASAEFNRIAGDAVRMGAQMLSLRSVFTSLNAVITGAAAAGTVRFGAAAVTAAGNWEELRNRLEAITGSAERAGQKLDFIRQHAAPSPFTTDQLAEAATRLEALGLSAQRALPIVSKLGAAFGADTERLMMLTRLLGDIATGNTPQKDVLGAFGITKDMLEREGALFDPQGRMISSAKQTMDALERLVDRRYGSIFARMGGSINARLSSFTDAWQQFQVRLGSVLSEKVMPIIEKLGGLIARMTQGDALQKWADRLASSLRAGGRVAEILTAVLVGMGAAAVITRIIGLAQAVLTFARALAAAAAAGAVLQTITSKGLALIPILGGVAAGIGAFVAMEQIMGRVQQELNTPTLTAPESPNFAGSVFNDPAAAAAAAAGGALQSIARNTRDTAVNTQKALDFRKFAIGGGELGAFGPGIIPGAGGRRGGGGGSGATININVGSDGTAREVYDTLITLKRRGLI